MANRYCPHTSRRHDCKPAAAFDATERVRPSTKMPASDEITKSWNPKHGKAWQSNIISLSLVKCPPVCWSKHKWQDIIYIYVMADPHYLLILLGGIRMSAARSLAFGCSRTSKEAAWTSGVMYHFDTPSNNQIHIHTYSWKSMQNPCKCTELNGSFNGKSSSSELGTVSCILRKSNT